MKTQLARLVIALLFVILGFAGATNGQVVGEKLFKLKYDSCYANFSYEDCPLIEYTQPEYHAGELGALVGLIAFECLAALIALFIAKKSSAEKLPPSDHHTSTWIIPFVFIPSIARDID